MKTAFLFAPDRLLTEENLNSQLCLRYFLKVAEGGFKLLCSAVRSEEVTDPGLM